jgi:hypothetical protein
MIKAVVVKNSNGGTIMAKGYIEWEHSAENGLIIRIKPEFGQLMNEEVHQHAVATKKEMLMTMRSLIDVAIQRTEGKKEKNKKRGVAIKVE